MFDVGQFYQYADYEVADPFDPQSIFSSHTIGNAFVLVKDQTRDLLMGGPEHPENLFLIKEGDFLVYSNMNYNDFRIFGVIKESAISQSVCSVNSWVPTFLLLYHGTLLSNLLHAS
jgi:hypothetical protein